MLCATSSRADQLIGRDCDAGHADREHGDDHGQAPRDAAGGVRRRLRARGQVGCGGPLEAVAECIELGVELGHRVLSMGSKRCLRRALRPRETRARTAWGVVARRSAASS